MTDQTNSPLDVSEIRLGGGFSEADVPLIETTLRQILQRLGALRGRSIEAELSVRDRDARGTKTTLEIWVHGLPRLVATSDLPDLRDALHEVGNRAVAQLDEAVTRREPKSNRSRRDSIREP
ncbi:MAG: HPF/RaiA family ribosome-associated protein [Austwickia sp.]|jgi:hypothetical protein|nr:HPF/RaiA family ribosome-associated protein [Austwickia sp.]